MVDNRIDHELKISSEYFEDVLNGRKTFELRKNDRDFKAGDIFRLNEIKNGERTGRYFIQAIGYVLKDCEKYGLDKEYCIFCW